MEALARAADRELRIYIVGGTTAVGPQLLAYFEKIEPDLDRYPALDPPSFRRGVEEAARAAG